MPTGPPGSRPHRLSTSTPPPSPPLTALAPAKIMHSPHSNTNLPSSPQEDRQDHGQDHHRHSSESPERAGRPKSRHGDKGSSLTMKGLQPPSPPLGDAGPTATAAAAAAAASYTMQELAIAYSMVTSTRQQQQEQERRQRRRQNKKDCDDINEEKGDDNSDEKEEESRRSGQEVLFERSFLHSQSLHPSFLLNSTSHHPMNPSSGEDNAAAHAAALALVRHRRHSPPPPADPPSDHQHRPQQPLYRQDHDRAPFDNDPSTVDDHNPHPRNSMDQGHARMTKEGIHSQQQQQQHAQIHPSSLARDPSRSSASVSHHPNALNRYPFSIPSISAKLDQPHHADGSDALSSLWKKTTPLQEPYFQTRHTIASQHTLSTLGGVLFSLDEVPLEFNQDMYIAMRNRIFELEAKSVNYSPFSHSRKRSMDRAGIEETADRFGGYDRRYEPGHYAKRPMHGHRVDPRGHPMISSAPSDEDRFPGPPPHHHRGSSSYPSWYTPEVYTGGSRTAYGLDRYPTDREVDYPSTDPRTGHELHPTSRPGSPHSNFPPMRSARSPPPQSGHPHPHGRQQGHATMEERYAMDERPHPGSSSVDSIHAPHPLVHRPSNHGVPPPRGSLHPAQHPQSQPSGASLQAYPHPAQGHAHPHSQSQPQSQAGPPSIAPRPLLLNGSSSAALAGQQQSQSIHQQRHRAQQQAQSAHSRSYHLHKHMRMLDQQRQAQLAAKQHFQQQQQEQQQQQQQQHHQKQQQLQQKQHPQNTGHGFRPIQRHYQPHQQMYPVHQQPIPIKPHPGPQQAQALRSAPGQQPQGQLSQQQLMMQRYHQQRQLQQKQLQLRQLQYLRNKTSAQYPTQANASPSALAAAAASSTPGSHSPTPPRVFGSQVDRPIKKSTRPLECANCMALDNLSWKPKADSTTKSSSSSSAPENEPSAEERSTILCSACTQYLQAHGKPRPVPPFRTNFLKKIHTRFKRELQDVRFQGWQDAQVLEIEDKMDEREFQMVFNGLDEADAATLQRPAKTSTPAAAATTPAAAETSTLPATSSSSTSSPKAAGSPNPDSDKAPNVTATTSGSAKASNIPEDLVIKIEDDDDERIPPNRAPKADELDVRTYQSEASVGELFGHRWRTEPVVGYTLVHFGGSDRTRMVPMNPTVPSLTVTFNRTSESITFAFRVLVNGLCLLSTGGGPPALHMPETADDDEEEEEEEEVVVIPDNDKEGSSASPLPDTKTPDRSDSVKQADPSDSLGA